MPQRCSWPVPAYGRTQPSAWPSLGSLLITDMHADHETWAGRPSTAAQPAPDLTERAVGATMTLRSLLIVDMNAKHQERHPSAGPQPEPAADGQGRSASAPCSTLAQAELAGHERVSAQGLAGAGTGRLPLLPQQGPAADTHGCLRHETAPQPALHAHRCWGRWGGGRGRGKGVGRVLLVSDVGTMLHSRSALWHATLNVWTCDLQGGALKQEHFTTWSPVQAAA